MSWIDELLAVREQTSERVRASALVSRLVAGKPALGAYAWYLLDVHAYATHNPTVIGMAAARSVQTNRGVGSYLFHHAMAEVGHEDWALRALRALGWSDDVILRIAPSLPCQDMIALEYYWASLGNPVSLMGWMYTLEALGDDLVHCVAAAIEAFQKEANLARHEAADHGHATDIVETLRAHVRADADRRDVIDVAKTASQLYEDIIAAAGARR